MHLIPFVNSESYHDLRGISITIVNHKLSLDQEYLPKSKDKPYS